MRTELETDPFTPAAAGGLRRAWFTDTLNDVNGVAMTIRKMASAASLDGVDASVVTSMSGGVESGFAHVNFAPWAQFRLPGYPSQKVALPPVRKIHRFLREGKFSEVIISTPGPVGLAALVSAGILGIRTAGIYHTDFPQYARILTGDSVMESLTWKFMEWFYGRMDVLWVNSESYRRTWAERGIAAEKLRILPRGIDTSLFQENRRSAEFWQNRGARSGSVVLLYVGRISKEKNLDVIAAAWERIRRPGVTLAFVGDGPYLPELRARLPDAIFTGYLSGEPLAEAFASADIFLFPSTTDTFGNVVVEALASGLPCIVSDVGGPQDLIEHGQTGFVTRGLDASDFASATARLIDDMELRETMRGQCAASVAQRSWQDAARRFLSPPPA